VAKLLDRYMMMMQITMAKKLTEDEVLGMLAISVNSQLPFSGLISNNIKIKIHETIICLLFCTDVKLSLPLCEKDIN
jgi:hypothetical protein